MASDIYSMTGYGKGVAEKDLRKITVEIKTVNHRFLDILFKFPRNFQFAETPVRATIGGALKRGHADVYLNYEDNRVSEGVSLNEELAAGYKKLGEKFAAMGINDDLTASALIKVPEMVRQTELDNDEETLLALITEAADKALENLLGMRRAEGIRLVNDIRLKLDGIASAVAEIKTRAPEVAKEYSSKLSQRISDALGEVELDQSRLATEVAFFVDRANIDEELTRLASHIANYREILDEGGAVGKKLDFLTQEANREVNTIGSKCNDLRITKLVLQLKNEIEMVREQIQNLE